MNTSARIIRISVGIYTPQRRKQLFKKVKKNGIILPLYETNPIAESETGDEKTLEDAVEMAKKWVDENKL